MKTLKKFEVDQGIDARMRKPDMLLFTSGPQRAGSFGFDGCRICTLPLDAPAGMPCFPELRAQDREEPLTVRTAGPGLGGIDE